MRSIQHPGQPDILRLAAQSVETQAFDVELPVGLSLLQSVTQSLAGLGASLFCELASLAHSVLFGLNDSNQI